MSTSHDNTPIPIVNEEQDSLYKGMLDVRPIAACFPASAVSTPKPAATK